MPILEEQSEELNRVRRVSDLLCTGHATLTDKWKRWASILDIVTLASSTWVVALAFVSPTLALKLTPFGWDSTIWLGTLSASTFFLTLVQLKTDWKSRADAHARTLDLYAEVKREAGYLLASDQADETAFRRVLASIPEKSFLALKRKHRLKILLSKQLDEHPGTSLLLFRIRRSLEIV